MLEHDEHARKLRESEERYRLLVEMSPDAVFVHRDVIVYMNPAAVRLMNGGSMEELIGQPIHKYIHPDSLQTINERIEFIMRTGEKSGPNEHKFVRPDGTVIYGEVHAARIIYEGEYAVQTICRDITQRKEYQLRLMELAYFDPLTNIPNRRFFLTSLKDHIELAGQHHLRLAVIYLDLNGFKIINDTLGHEAGDQLLVEFTHRIKKCLRQNDVFSRIGGDEFVILLFGITGRKDVKAVTGRIIRQMEQSMCLREREIHITVSMGISLYPEHGETTEALLNQADQASSM